MNHDELTGQTTNPVANNGGSNPPTEPAASDPNLPATHPAEAAIRLAPNRPGPQAHPALPQPELDRIVIDRLRVHARHGVFAHERQTGQYFYIDAEVWVDTRAAAESDEISDTVHYGHLMRALYEVAMREPVDLLETLAERLAAVTFAFNGPQAVRITVHKPQAPVKLRFDDVAISILRYRPEGPQPASTRSPHARTVIALGSNLGDREANLRQAMDEIEALDGVWPGHRSSLYETAALTTHGIDDDKPAYLNAVMTVLTDRTPHDLLHELQQIEADHGRVRTERWGDRTLDLDIIEHGGLQLRDDELELPHPRAFERAFVLTPWHEIEPHASIPGRGALEQLLEHVTDTAVRYRKGTE